MSLIEPRLRHVPGWNSAPAYSRRLGQISIPSSQRPLLALQVRVRRVVQSPALLPETGRSSYRGQGLLPRRLSRQRTPPPCCIPRRQLLAPIRHPRLRDKTGAERLPRDPVRRAPAARLPGGLRQFPALRLFRMLQAIARSGGRPDKTPPRHRRLAQTRQRITRTLRTLLRKRLLPDQPPAPLQFLSAYRLR